MQPEKRKSNPTDYLANERTFLAWVRTSIGIMAFGFVVVKFSLFVKQLSYILNPEHVPDMPTDQGYYSSRIGIVLVTLGVCSIIFSYVRYRSTNKQLENGWYQHSTLYINILTAAIVFISMLLVFYLFKQLS